MTTGLEQVHAVTEQALKNLDQEARRLNRRLSETREDIAKAKAEYEQVQSSLTEAREELASVKSSKSSELKAIDDHRQSQTAVLEQTAKSIETKTRQHDQAADAAARKEQQAQANLSKFLETRSVFLDRVQAFRTSINGAVDQLLKDAPDALRHQSP